jgi:hypothetical protein
MRFFSSSDHQCDATYVLYYILYHKLMTHVNFRHTRMSGVVGDFWRFRWVRARAIAVSGVYITKFLDSLLNNLFHEDVFY